MMTAMAFDPRLKDTADRLVTAGHRTLAREVHPDHGGSNEAMRDVNLAAEALRELLDGGSCERAFGVDPEDPDAFIVGPARCLWETERGILVRAGQSKIWFPKRQIAPQSEVREEGDAGVLVVSRWIAQRKGLAS
jgi:hypothetical protein